ncbi:hypothetical protein ACEPUD_06290 [Burkholderia ubonensis]|uniref:hypothetical protein n=1 Tax=Burkholderia ubonensis TaxID=101571 RepID=UPI00358F6A8D
MLDEETYQRLLDTHGRRVANRAAVCQMPKDQRDWSMFYQCYGPESALPENERCRTDVIGKFDPTVWHALYRNHPADERSPIYHVTNGASAYWFDQLVNARKFWGGWVIRFLYTSLVRDEPHEVYDRIADDQGEFATADGDVFSRWFPGWRGWMAWTNSLSDDDLSVLRIVFAWLCGNEFEHSHPEPEVEKEISQ